MKTKKFHKKLALNKKTIVHLSNGDLKGVDGGKLDCATGEVPTCITYNTYTCHTCEGYTNCRTCPITCNPTCFICDPIT
jgi:hypothetical protein